MKKYTIEVSGKGGEVYIFPLTDEQKEKLENGDVEGDGMSIDEITEVLEVEFISDTDDVITGLYPNPNLLDIRVYNENGDKIWESDEELNLQSDEVEYLYNEPNTLVVEDYFKGTPFVYELEIEEEFDPKHLSPIIVDIAETIELLTNLKYKNVDLGPYKDWGDYWSKGYTFYLF